MTSRLNLRYRDLIDECNLTYSGDAWGNTMSWWFAVAGEMYTRNLPIPVEWRYRPGVSPKEPDAYETEVCEHASDGALIHFGNVLHRYANKLKAAGKDY